MNRVAEVNRALRLQGLPYRLVRGRGYYYFAGGDAAGWPTSSVMAYRASDLPVAEWLAELASLRQAAREPLALEP